MMKKFFLLALIVSVVFIGCKDDDPKNENVSLKINVKGLTNNSGIKAYIFLDDSLYGTTDINGELSINAIKSGNYELVCSAINFRDTAMQLNLGDEASVNLNFSLPADTSWGRVHGEFQDMFLWRKKLAEIADLASWSEQKRYDIATGATLFYKYFEEEPPIRYILLDNETIAETDGFGQYSVKLQCGTYKLTGSCEGYLNSSGIIKVLPNTKVYLNFYLERK